jgi:hypothetical protein
MNTIAETSCLYDMVEYIISISGRQGLYNNGKPWTGEEKELVIKMATADIDLKLISRILGRSQVAITMKLDTLGVTLSDGLLSEAQKNHRDDLKKLSSYGYMDVTSPESNHILRMFESRRKHPMEPYLLTDIELYHNEEDVSEELDELKKHGSYTMIVDMNDDREYCMTFTPHDSDFAFESKAGNIMDSVNGIIGQLDRDW